MEDDDDDSATQTTSGVTFTGSSQIVNLVAFRGGAGITTPVEIATAPTNSPSGTSHEIALPDGEKIIGRGILLFVTYSGLSPSVGRDSIAAHGFSYTGYTSASGSVLAFRRILDGTEGWADTGETLSVTTGASTALDCHAVMLDSAAEFIASGDNSGDPPSRTSPWDDALPARWYTFSGATTSISGDPSGYTNVASGSGAFPWRASAKDDDSQTEDPSAYTTSGALHAITLAVRGGTPTTASGGETGWGSIPEGFGVDTDAPWLGGNGWSTDGSGVQFSVDGSAGLITLTGDDQTAYAYLSSDEADDASGEPWGPWSDGVVEFLLEWSVNAVGDLNDTDANRFSIGVYDGNSRNKCYINLGDGVSWAYMDPDQQRGIVLGTGTTSYSSFVPKTIEAGVDYYTRIDFRGDTLRARLWKKSEAEPSAWDVALAREIETGLSDVGWLRLDLDGNDGLVLSVANIDTTPGGIAGQFVVRHIIGYGDGSTTTFAVEQPFTIGSLLVWVDSLPVVPSSTDAAAGTFTLATAPYGDPSNTAGSAVIEAAYEVA
jgi:hypothetical protein